MPVTMTAETTETYSTVEVCRLTGATYRQLDYWCRKGLIPGLSTGHGSGSRRRWSREQIAEAILLLTASRMVNAPLDAAVAELRRATRAS